MDYRYKLLIVIATIISMLHDLNYSDSDKDVHYMCIEVITIIIYLYVQ